jgi:hypothetical protein
MDQSAMHMNTGDQSTELKIRIDRIEQFLMFDYEPGSEDALFDLCTLDGTILKTGEIKGPVTRVRLKDVQDGELVLMVLDGERSMVRPVQYRKAV